VSHVPVHWLLKKIANKNSRQYLIWSRIYRLDAVSLVLDELMKFIIFFRTTVAINRHMRMHAVLALHRRIKKLSINSTAQFLHVPSSLINPFNFRLNFLKSN